MPLLVLLLLQGEGYFSVLIAGTKPLLGRNCLVCGYELGRSQGVRKRGAALLEARKALVLLTPGVRKGVGEGRDGVRGGRGREGDALGGRARLVPPAVGALGPGGPVGGLLLQFYMLACPQCKCLLSPLPGLMYVYCGHQRCGVQFLGVKG